MTQEIDNIVAELRLQGWECALKSDAASWKAVPPDGSRMVVFAAHAKDATAILRDLRHRGFKWPPKIPVSHPTVEAKITSVPFPPKPHPEVHTEPIGSAAHIESTRDDGAIAFAKLQDAKEYERLAAAELLKCQADEEQAHKKTVAASATYGDAVRGLRECKDAFDRIFSSDLTNGVDR